MLMTFISGAYIPVSGAHFVINRAWALHHKLGQPELLDALKLKKNQAVRTKQLNYLQLIALNNYVNYLFP